VASLHGSQTGLLIDGRNMAPYFNEFSIEASQAMHDATVFGNSSRVKVPGLKDGKANGTGFFDPTTTIGSFAVLKSNFTSQSPGSPSPSIVAFAVAGFAVGNRVVMGYLDQAQFGVKTVIDGLEMVTFSGEADQDGVDYGVSLHALSAETSLPVTGTVVDNAAASTNGGVGMVHTTAIAGADPNVVYRIQHSTDNSSWVDLIVFTAITAAVTALRTEVAAGTAIRRYLRATATEGGTTTSITSMAGFARR
jgi:hypothetical protein